MAPGDKPAASQDLGNAVHRDHNVRFAVPMHVADGVRPRIGRPGAIAVMEVEEAQARIVDQVSRVDLTERGQGPHLCVATR